MANYIKSHSNYVLQSKHQDIKDGTIYERDITTIGGVGNFPNGQTPIYRSNNFIVSVRNDSQPSNQHNTSQWEKNDTSGTVWNLQSISALTADTIEENDTKIVLKQDYYDLSDFAYYGSVTELFRTSVTDIISRFPGELYVTDHNVYYTSAYTEDFETIEDSIILGGEEYYEVSNPFGINLHSTIVPSGENPLKYLNANNGYENYIVGFGDYVGSDITTYAITAYSSETQPNGGYVQFSETRVGNNLEVNGIDIALKEEQKGKRAFTINIYVNDCLSGNCNCNGYMFDPALIDEESSSNGREIDYGNGLIQSNGLTIFGYIGDDCRIVYLSKVKGIHIRPKKEFIDRFYNECDNFEKLLMNKDTNYTATFSVIRENKFGYYRELVPLQFPMGDGGYNIDASDYGFNLYTTKMVEIGEYYDEYFSDNLWRSMTHEAIKNFDWTHTREFNEGDEEEYVIGGQRIQKALRLFAREFDETLSYINNIKSANRVTYDERSNIPDYFLTDVVENEGWDVKLVYPYILEETFGDDKTKVPLNDYIEHNNFCRGQIDNVYRSGTTDYHIVREFSQNANASIRPYGYVDVNSPYGYFNICGVDEKVESESIKDTKRYDKKALGGKGVLKNVIRGYSDTTSWTYNKANNEFLRRLKINSPYIWRHKGTVEGIEMILAMFGLKSDRWARENNGDYKVTEYTTFAHRIQDKWDALHQDYRINWINTTKTIAYDNRSISNDNKYGLEVNTIPYQGLLVAYRDEYETNSNPYEGDYTREDGTRVLKRYLYPNFEKGEQLDGNPYFQMNGGWMSKVIDNKWNFQFDVDDNIVYSEYPNGNTLYKETVRNIRRTNNINGLLSVPTNDLYNGVTCYVTNIETNAMVIDGVVYPLQSEWYNESIKYYVSFVKSDGFVKVGLDKFFNSTMIVYNEEGEETIIDIEDKEDGYEVKAYIINNTFICKEDWEGNYTISNYVKLDTIWTNDKFTNYFILDDINYASEIAKFDANISGYTSGWRRLEESSSDYMKINTIINYNKGNNPHNGNMVYDNGHEYFTYYKKIFKYALENELFDGRCYDDLYETMDDEIPTYGFSGLIDDDEDVKCYDNKLIEDTKIHYFGNYKSKRNNDSLDVCIYGDNEERWEQYRTKYNKDDEVLNGFVLRYNIARSNKGTQAMIGESPYPTDSEVDEVTNQIVNNKRLTIEFKLHDKWFSNQGQCEMKYLDDIVMNYLTQMIPSSAILQVKYTSKV